EAAARLVLTTDLDAIGDAAIIVENVVERWELKRELYPRLDAASDPAAGIAANTSCISLTRLGRPVRDPARVIGTHFMNPAYLSEAVEVVRGHHTSAATLARAGDLVKAVGKEAIVVEDLPGFASNRVSHLFMNEAAWAVHDGVATAEAMDRLF